MFQNIDNTPAVEYLVCGSCSVVLANGDDSHIADEDISTVTATVEAMGWVTYGGEFDSGYFRCYVCGWDEVAGHVWHGSH